MTYPFVPTKFLPCHCPKVRSRQLNSEACAQVLLTSHGLRSYAPHRPNYSGHYCDSTYARDSVHHQGTVWGWLLGPFALAHLWVYQQPPKPSNSCCSQRTSCNGQVTYAQKAILPVIVSPAQSVVLLWRQPGF